jgi:hypothetical protein
MCVASMHVLHGSVLRSSRRLGCCRIEHDVSPNAQRRENHPAAPGRRVRGAQNDGE